MNAVFKKSQSKKIVNNDTIQSQQKSTKLFNITKLLTNINKHREKERKREREKERKRKREREREKERERKRERAKLPKSQRTFLPELPKPNFSRESECYPVIQL